MSTGTTENLKKVESVEDDANSFLLSLYHWKAYDPIDRHGWLVKQSVPTAKRLMYAKVGLFV